MKIKSFDFLIHISFLITTIIFLFVMLNGNEVERMICSTLPMLCLLVFYFKKKIKVNLVVLISMLLTIVANVFFVDNNNFNIGMFFFTLVHLALIQVVFNYIKEVNRKNVYFYFMSFLIFFLIIFYIVFGGFTNEKYYYITLIYGIVTSFLGGVAFTNYLFKMNFKNFVLFAGIFLGIASDCIYGISLLIEESVYYNFFGVLIYTLSYYLIYNGIFLIETELTKKR
ncbi:hypothetical protein WH52_10075 [Tenacibaculum holothuriorum]|uniref:YhhN-like protein n=1 Tax=Tenacibaculum holothuriorum TaxID=1635173 RepID=A0A1Y2PBD8_9FLAO|nr:lysoplasmalogenase family protein [Tenacibaculum holothuriorum]OSY87765.1 hypothetical protein WH52_10075 [Tenacibaculum holothuriorum]